MKFVAITAFVALLVSLPFVLSKQQPSPVRSKPTGTGNPIDENTLYDTEDFMT